jgi:hypothetical protein
MRRLSLLALVALAALPLSAHDHWRDSHRVVVVAEPRFAPCRPWKARRWERQGYVRRRDCGRVSLWPLPPFQGGVELGFR